MIYIIGGPPKCGKSFLSKKFEKETGIQIIGTDMLQSIILPYIAKTQLSRFFPHTSVRKKTTNDIYYSKWTSQQIVHRYIKQAKITDKAVKVLIDYRVQNSKNLIIEGYGITPKFANELIKKYGSENIRVLFIVKTDSESILSQLLHNKGIHGWIEHRTINTDIYPKIVQMISLYSLWYKKEAEKYNLFYIDGSDDFDSCIHKGLTYLKMGELNQKD